MACNWLRPCNITYWLHKGSIFTTSKIYRQILRQILIWEVLQIGKIYSYRRWYLFRRSVRNIIIREILWEAIFLICPEYYKIIDFLLQFQSYFPVKCHKNCHKNFYQNFNHIFLFISPTISIIFPITTSIIFFYEFTPTFSPTISITTSIIFSY